MKINLKRSFINILIISLLSIGSPFVSHASNATYTVALDGTGDFKTIAEAYKKAVDGDVIIVKPGIYTEIYTGWGSLCLNKNGITIRSEVQWGAIIDNQKAENAEEVVYFTGDRNIIDGFVLRNSLGSIVYIYGDEDQIINCNLYNSDRTDHNQSGIYSNPRTKGTIISGNYIHDIGRTPGPNDVLDHGIYACSDNEVITNNIITNCSSHGIQVAGYDMVENMKIYNNTIAYTGTSAIVIWDGFGVHDYYTDTGVNGVAVKNNIFYNCGMRAKTNVETEGIEFTGMSMKDITVANNITFGSKVGLTTSRRGFTSIDNIVADPMFIDDKSDYHLKAGSPAIDNGKTLEDVKEDIDGASRPLGSAYDIGAYESSYSVAVTKPTTSPAPVVKVSIVTLNKANLNLKIKQTYNLVATIKPINATIKTFIWTSSDTKIATVDSKGKVTAKAFGKAIITVTTTKDNKSSICGVRVSK